jgi:molecular chaperone DnaK
VNVSAREQQTGKEQKITITGSSGLDKGEIDRMVEEAERNAAEDQKRREAVETKNQLDATVFQVKKFRDDNADKIGEAEKTQLESALNAAEEALKGDDQDAMKSANDQLTQAFQAAGTSVYQNAPQDGGAAGAGATSEPSGSDFAGYDSPNGSANGATAMPSKAKSSRAKSPTASNTM